MTRPSNLDGRVFVSALYIYPVKSLPGFSLREAYCEERGLRHDRRFMLTDEDGRFITQREEPRLALLSVSITRGMLRIRGPHRAAALSVPLDVAGGRKTNVVVWDDTVEAQIVSDDDFFSEFIGRRARLVHMPPRVRRLVPPKHGGPSDLVSFADAFPVLVLSDASIDEVSTRVGEQIPVTRYRPNVVLSGLKPFEEDVPASFRVGRAHLRGVHPCARCVIVDTDPETGTVDRKVLKVLAKFRKEDNKVYLGQNALVAACGRLRVGAEVRVTRE